ncbi:MAG TPA: hypothetical protein VEO54_15945 [Thermoanaerobaculia bacterium]|nr:hypothetical protein [Thermoanaerobaculia bacterium]
MAAALHMALPCFAQVLTDTPKGIVTAHDHRIELAGRWNVEGVQHATAIAASDERVVVLDALNNEAVIVTLASGAAQRIQTKETPTAASFVGKELYLLARDAGILHRVGGEDTSVAADLLKGEYLYSRATGTLQKIGGKPMQLPPFASDLEVDGDTVYLTYPREALVRSVRNGEIATVRVGAVPVDLAIAGNRLAVADPSSKRVWVTEARQSVAEALARGFLRGFLGLSGGRRDAALPTGVDRVETRGRVWIAYDSSSGTLYHVTPRQSTLLARNVPPHAFALTENGVAWWNGTSVAQKSLR